MAPSANEATGALDGVIKNMLTDPRTTKKSSALSTTFFHNTAIVTAAVDASGRSRWT